MRLPAPTLSPSQDYKQVYRRLRIRTFALTWLAYAFFYLCRTNYSVVKSTVARNFGFDSLKIGYIDTTYLSLYAVGQFTNGVLGDRIGGRVLVGTGLIATALLNIAFGSATVFPVFLIAYGLNGFAQSAGWPGCAKAFSNWFAVEERGTVMGIWCTCYQAGAVLSTALATWLLVNFGWRSAWFVPAAIVGSYAVVFLMWQKKSPAEEGLPDVETYYAETTGRKPVVEVETADTKWGWHDVLFVLRNRVIWTLGVTYVFLKFIRYSFLFWLPFYLSQSLKYPEGEAGYALVVFELAGIGGAILAGIISDRLFGSRRAPIVVLMMLALAGVSYLYANAGSLSRSENLLLVALIGVLIYGPDSVAAGAATVDFGSRRGASAAAGFVNGMGSIGAAFSGVAIGYVSKRFGWSTVFHMFGPLALMGALCMATIWNARPKKA